MYVYHRLYNSPYENDFDYKNKMEWFIGIKIVSLLFLFSHFCSLTAVQRMQNFVWLFTVHRLLRRVQMPVNL